MMFSLLASWLLASWLWLLGFSAFRLFGFLLVCVAFGGFFGFSFSHPLHSQFLSGRCFFCFRTLSCFLLSRILSIISSSPASWQVFFVFMFMCVCVYVSDLCNLCMYVCMYALLGTSRGGGLLPPPPPAAAFVFFGD